MPMTPPPAMPMPPANPQPQPVQPFPQGNPVATPQQQAQVAGQMPPAAPDPGHQQMQPGLGDPSVARNPMFRAPVPGQSLTDTPKNAAWEHPPQFVKLKDACDFIFNQLTNEDMLHQLFYLFENGFTVEEVAKIIIFTGFHQGKWTVDLGMLMAKPLVYMLAGIAQKAGIKAKLTRKSDPMLRQLANMQAKKRMGNLTSTLDGTKPSALDEQKLQLGKGLMAPPTGG